MVPRLTAYVAGGVNPPAAAELRSMLVNRLPRYLVPHHIVILDELPLTPHGKIDENALAATDRRRGPSNRARDADRDRRWPRRSPTSWELRTSTSRPAFCKWVWTASWPCRSCRPPAVVASRCGPG